MNPPHLAPHEFYLIVVPGGPLLLRLAVLEDGAPIWLGARANGFFSIPELPPADVLWCLATGTGIGAFSAFSTPRTAEPWARFERVVLVHAVRHVVELTYRDAIAGIAAERAGAFGYIPMVSRDVHAPDALAGRIPAAIEDGRLEARVGIALAAGNSHVMLCGNPGMVEDTQKVLGQRGMPASPPRAGSHHGGDVLVRVAGMRPVRVEYACWQEENTRCLRS